MEIAHFVAERRDAKEVSLRMAVYEPMSQTADIDVREGATARLDGCVFTLDRIERVEIPSTSVFGSSPCRYRLLFTRSGEPRRKATFWIGSRERLYCSSDGELVSQEEYDRWNAQPKALRSALGDEASFERASIGGQSDPTEHTVDVGSNFIPSRVGKLQIKGNYLRTVDIVGIPLDPR